MTVSTTWRRVEFSWVELCRYKRAFRGFTARRYINPRYLYLYPCVHDLASTLGGGIFPLYRSFVSPSVRPFVCYQISILNSIFWKKRVKHFYCKLSQVFYEAREWNSQLLESKKSVANSVIVVGLDLAETPMFFCTDLYFKISLKNQSGTVSDNLWRRFCSQRTDAFSALEVSRRCAI